MPNSWPLSGAQPSKWGVAVMRITGKGRQRGGLINEGEAKNSVETVR